MLHELRDLLNQRQKSVKFHTFGPDPPLKSVKAINVFFFKHELTNI